ncbi:MAG TPA: hypothetical protein VJT72_18285 [Pseudonocardiaceae bacterium]|nr:hypothetical protein [Pseudonocardiaceae bacterium]
MSAVSCAPLVISEPVISEGITRLRYDAGLLRVTALRVCSTGRRRKDRSPRQL